MHKRVLTMVLTLVLLMGMIVFPTNAATVDEESALCQTITQTYKKVYRLNGNRSFHGFCGKMAAYTLYILGIDKYCHTHNGNDEYDAYKNLDVTTGGYSVTTYHSSKYTLEEALMAVSEGGTKDVYNILVGWQRTNTSAGRYYGHALVIYGILDGYVYFTESFDSQLSGKEGKPASCTIQKFAESYDKWTTFEGLVYFGTKQYSDFCEYYPADLFVKTTDNVAVYNIPSNAEVDGTTAEVLANILSNERLEVVGLYRNTLDQLFYEIRYDGISGYVEADKTVLLRANADKFASSGFNTPEDLRQGKSFSVNGDLMLQEGILNNIKLTITDKEGTDLYSYTMNKTGYMASISRAASNAMKFSKLPVGIYTYKVTCEVVNYYVENGELLPHITTKVLADKEFKVGEVAEDVPAVPPVEPVPEEPLNGWQFDVATRNWKYYIEGELAYGWVLDGDTDFYILEDGTAAVGGMEINGEMRYFTPSGVMRTGWYETETGAKLYLLRNGAPAKGWYKIDGTLCFFAEDGAWDPTAEYVPENIPSLSLPTDGLFASLLQSINKFSALYGTLH